MMDRMTDEQIIEALDCCNRIGGSCSDCPSYGGVASCIKNLTLNAYYIIKDQKAEIKRLKNKNAILSRNADTAFQDGLNENRDLFEKEVEREIREKTKKEFVERLKRVISDERFSRYGIEYEIDRIAKEMTEVQR